MPLEEGLNLPSPVADHLTHFEPASGHGSTSSQATWRPRRPSPLRAAPPGWRPGFSLGADHRVLEDADTLDLDPHGVARPSQRAGRTQPHARRRPRGHDVTGSSGKTVVRYSTISAQPKIMSAVEESWRRSPLTQVRRAGRRGRRPRRA